MGKGKVFNQISFKSSKETRIEPSKTILSEKNQREVES